MPAKDRVRLDQDESRTPAGIQFCQANPEEAVAAMQRRSRPLLAENGQLLTQGQVLQDQLAAGQQKQTEKKADGVEQFHAVELRAICSRDLDPSSHRVTGWERGGVIVSADRGGGKVGKAKAEARG